MAAKKGKVQKVSLKDLLGGGDSNADLHKKDETKRRYHVRYRAPRDRLMHLHGDEYTRPLAGDPATDIRYHELAREFINNGLDGAKAYAAVYGVPIKDARSKAVKVFNSSWMRSKIREYLLGKEGEFDDLPKDYLVERLIQMIDNNILDYIDDDGQFLNVRELKALPEWAQQQIRRLTIRNEMRHVAIRDQAGVLVRDEDGHPETIEVRQQHVTIELYDKQKAMEHLAKVMNWISTNIELNVNLGPDMMRRAEERVRKLRREDIEGTAERITTD